MPANRRSSPVTSASWVAVNARAARAYVEDLIEHAALVTVRCDVKKLTPPIVVPSPE